MEIEEGWYVGRPCSGCGEEWTDEGSEAFDFWSDFWGPVWIDLREYWCESCILERFRSEFPEYAESRLSPEVFLVWKMGLDEGIDLTPKLDLISTTNVLRQLSMYSYEAATWLNLQMPLEEIVLWPWHIDEPEVAAEWHDLGFRPDEEEIGIWITRYKGSARTAAEELGRALDVRWGKLGLTVEEGQFFESHGMTDDETRGGDFVGTWLGLGLSNDDIVKLVKLLMGQHWYSLVEIHEDSVLSEDRGERGLEEDLWAKVPRVIAALRGAGLRISFENLRIFWGVDSEKILAVIDTGCDPELGAYMVRLGATLRSVGTATRLTERGLSSRQAALLIKRGMTKRLLDEIERSDTPDWVLKNVLNHLEESREVDAQEALTWVNRGVSAFGAFAWRQLGVDAERAAEWAQAGWSANDAKKWLAAGVKSPVVAARRRDAGIEP